MSFYFRFGVWCRETNPAFWSIQSILENVWWSVDFA